MLEHRSAWLVVNTSKGVCASEVYRHKAFQITHLHATVISGRTALLNTRTHCGGAL